MVTGAKKITVVLAASGAHNDLAIDAGTTAGDILNAIGHGDYVLSREGEPAFNGSDNVYPLVQDGQRLYAAPYAESGLTPAPAHGN